MNELPLFSSAERRRLASENPYVVLGIPPALDSRDVKSVQDEAQAKYRKIVVQYHPDKAKQGEDPTESFKNVSRAYAKIENSGFSEMSAVASGMVFGSESEYWTPAMHRDAQPLLDALVPAWTKARLAEGKTVPCSTCGDRGFIPSQPKGAYFPVPVPCIDCGGEGALPPAVHALREAFVSAFGSAAPLEPFWNENDTVTPPNDEQLPARPLSQNLREAIERYVLSDPSLGTRPFVSEMSRKLVSIANQAITLRRQLSAFPMDLSEGAAAQRILLDCEIGIGYLEARKGEDAVRSLISKQDWATIVATGRSLRITQEEKCLRLRKQNEFHYMRGESSERSREGFLSQHVFDTAGSQKEKYLLSYPHLADWRAELAECERILKSAEDMGITPESTSRYAQQAVSLRHFNGARAEQSLGFHEVATFISAIRNARPSGEDDLFDLGEGFESVLEKCFVPTGGGRDKYRLSEKARVALMERAAALFPDNPVASQQVSFVLHNYLDALNHTDFQTLPTHLAKENDAAEYPPMHAVYPNASVQKKFHARLRPIAVFSRIAEDHFIPESDATGITHAIPKAHFPNATQLLNRKTEALANLSSDYPAVLDWREVALMETEEAAQIIDRLCESGKASAQILACGLFYLCLSTDKVCLEERTDAFALFDEGSEMFAAMAKRDSKPTRLLAALTQDSLRYVMQYGKAVWQNAMSVQDLITHFNNEEDHHQKNSIHKWHPLWQSAKPDKIVDTIETMIDSGQPIADMVADAVHRGDIKEKDFAFVLMNAHRSDQLGSTTYIRDILRKTPDDPIYNTLYDGSLRALNVFLQNDSHINDIAESVRPKNREKVPEYLLDLPLRVYADDTGNGLRPFPASWGETNAFIDHLKKAKMEGRLARIATLPNVKTTTGSMVLEDPLNANAEHITLLMPHAFRKADFDLLTAMTKDEHPYLPLIIDNALKSGKGIRQSLLTDVLKIEDAAPLALAIVQEAVKKDKSLKGITCAALAESILENKTLPEGIAVLATPFAKRPELRETVASLFRINAGNTIDRATA